MEDEREKKGVDREIASRIAIKWKEQHSPERIRHQLIERLSLVEEQFEMRLESIFEEIACRMSKAAEKRMKDLTYLMEERDTTPWRSIREIISKYYEIQRTSERKDEDIITYLMEGGFRECGIEENQIWLDIGVVRLKDKGLEVELGPYRIVFYTVGSLTCRVVCEQSCGWVNERAYRGIPCIHPHVGLEGIVCYGYSGEVGEERRKRGDFIGQVEIIRGILGTYNQNSPYVKLDEYATVLEMEGTRCCVCHTWVKDIEEMEECIKCGHLFCKDPYCKSEELRCYVCETEGKGIMCGRCGTRVIIARCAECGRGVCSSHRAKGGEEGKWLCVECNETKKAERDKDE